MSSDLTLPGQLRSVEYDDFRAVAALCHRAAAEIERLQEMNDAQRQVIERRETELRYKRRSTGEPTHEQLARALDECVNRTEVHRAEIARLEAEVLKLRADLAFYDGYRQAIEEARQRGRR